MANQHLVSIIIPCYNREKYIKDAVDSCLRQSYRNIEIIVVDDGSIDNSVAVLKSYGEKITLIQQPNQGVSVARNTGINVSKGDFLIFLDSDDWISDDLVENHIRTFNKWGDIEISCADSKAAALDGSETNIRPSNWPNIPSSPNKLFLLIPPPFPACEMYRASTVKKLGGFYDDMKAFADSSLRIRIVLHGGKVVRTEQGFATYRPVENSITRNRSKLHFYALKLIQKLNDEFDSNTEIANLLKARLRKHRIRYWFGTFSHHIALNPLSILKCIRHLVIVSKVDPKYIIFIISEKPWKLTPRDSF